MRNYFSTDGEAIILKQAFNAEIQTLFEEQLIDYVKGGASTTGIHNALDRTTCFRDVRLACTKASERNLNVENVSIQMQLKDAIKNLERMHSIDISSIYTKKIIYGCEIITHAMQCGAITKEKLAHGFRVCGQHVPFSEYNPTKSSISFECIMSQCYKTVSMEDLNTMAQHIPYFVDILQKNGEIKECEFDAKNIPRLPDCDYDVRNELVLWRQRAVVITNVETVRRFVNYEKLRISRLDSQLQRSLSIIAKYDRAQEREITKVTQKTNQMMMTPENREKAKQDKLSKSLANKQAKEQKRLDSIAAYDAAKLYVLTTTIPIAEV